MIFQKDVPQKRQAMDILAGPLLHLKTLIFVLLRRAKAMLAQITIMTKWAKSLKMYSRGLFYPKLSSVLI